MRYNCYIFSKLVFTEKENIHTVHVLQLLYTRGSPIPKKPQH